MAKNADQKNVLELTDEEMFVVKCLLEQARYTHDSDAQNIAKIADALYNRIPDTDVTWSDVEPSAFA